MEVKHKTERTTNAIIRCDLSEADSSNSEDENEQKNKNENYMRKMFQCSNYRSASKTECVKNERAYNNKTDDDKIHADKIACKVNSDDNKLRSNSRSRDRTTTSDSDEDISPRSKLPDLIPSVSPNALTPTMDEDTLSDNEYSDSPPPLPLSKPPVLERTLSSPPVLQSTESPPPPLPVSSPPPLVKEMRDVDNDILTDENSVEVRYGDSEESFVQQDSSIVPCYNPCTNNAVFDNASFQEKEEREHLLSDYDSDSTLENDSDHNESPGLEHKSELDVDDEIQEINSASVKEINGVDNVVVPDDTGLSNAEQTFLSLLSEFTRKDTSDASMDFDDEFEAIFDSVNASNRSQDPYYERFAGRRDKYGFILSPIVESPSPTPSCMSSYSGLSSASPDPFCMFRVSPAPRSGKRDLDLSSLSKSVSEWEAIEEEKTVPIYQTRPKIDLYIPESTGWESGDDLLTPTSATEWDATPSGLSTPPVNSDLHFGAQLKSLQQPDNIIYEESESSSAECDSDDSDGTIYGSDTHLHDDESGNEIADTPYTDTIEIPAHISCMQKHNSVCTDVDVFENVALANGGEKADLLNAENNSSEINSDGMESCRQTLFNVNNANVESNTNDDSSNDVNQHSLQTSTDAALRQTLMNLGCFQNEDMSDLSESDHVTCDSDDEYYEESGDENDINYELKTDGNEITTNNEQSINIDDYHECLNSTAYIFVPTSSVVVSGTMTPDNIDSTSSSDEEPESPNMSSFGSGIKVSQYTSGDSRSSDSDSNTNGNNINSDKDTFIQNNETASETNEQDRDEKSKMRLHSPLEFSFFDANKPSVGDKSPRSPRVLGRHYLEMDDTEKTFCTSPPVMTEFQRARDMENKDANVFISKPSKTYDTSNPDLEESFQTVQFKRTENDQAQENDTLKNQRELSPVSSDSESDVEHHDVKERLSEISNVSKRIIHAQEQYHQHYLEAELAKESHTRNNEFQTDGKISKANVSRIANSPVKIRIAHLRRKVSSRNKIKPGYVKQVSKIFSDDRTQDLSEVRTPQNEPSSSLPFTVYSDIDTLMPKEEIQIVCDYFDEGNDNGILQCEEDIIVTPLIHVQDSLQADWGSAETVLESTNLPESDQTENYYCGNEIEVNKLMRIEMANTCNEQYAEGSGKYKNENETVVHKSLVDAKDNSDEYPCLMKEAGSVQLEDQTRQIENGANEVEHTKLSGFEPVTDFRSDETVTVRSSLGFETNDIEKGSNVGDSTFKMISSLGFETSDIDKGRHVGDNTSQVISTLGFETTDIVKESQVGDAKSKIVFSEQDIPNLEQMETHENYNSDSDKSELTENSGNNSNDTMGFVEIVEDNGTKTFCSIKEEKTNVEILSTEDEMKEPVSESQNNSMESSMLNHSGNVNTIEDIGLPHAESSQNSTADMSKEIHFRENNFWTVIEKDTKVLESNACLGVKPSVSRGTPHSRSFTESPEMITVTSNTERISRGNITQIQEQTPAMYVDNTANETDSFSTENYIICVSSKSECSVSKGPNYVNVNNKSLPSFSELTSESDEWFSIVDQINKFKAANPSFFHKADTSLSCIKDDVIGNSYGPVLYTNSDSFQDFQTTDNAQSSNDKKETDSPVTFNSQRNICHQTDDICDNILEDFDSEIFNYEDTNNYDELSDLELFSFADEAAEATYPNIFQHTFYDVRKPITTKSKLLKRTLSQADYSIQAKRNTVTVNNTNANHSDTFLPLAKCNDANCDKGVFHFPMPACQSVGETNFVQVDSRCCIINSENIDVISRSTEGGDKLSPGLTNECYRQNEGVHIPRRLTANKNTHQTLAMNYDTAANVNSGYDTRFHITRINGNNLRETQDVFHSRMPRSDISAKKGGSHFSQDTSVGVTTLDNPVLFQSSVYDHVIEDETGSVKGWPYSDIENQDRVPVKVYKTFKKVSPKQSEKMKIVQAEERSAEMPDDRTVKKYHSSSVLPANTTEKQLMKSHSESIQEALQTDANGNMLNDEEIANVLPKLAETIANMKNVNAEEVLPGITQTVAKLKDGGNLVITTMTRKLVEDEEEIAEAVPPHPVLDVDDLENSKIYLVQDSKGDMFYVEDVTSESQESAYFSSSRHTSESVSDSGSSPTFQRISKIQPVGKSGINEATAEELISAMYEQNGVTEIDEFEDEYSERTYEFDLPKDHRYQDSFPKRDYNKDSFKTSYMVEEPDTSSLPGQTSAAQGGKTTTKDHFESSYEVTSGQPWVFDGAAGQYGPQANYSNAMQASSEELDRASTLSETDNVYRMQNVVRSSDGHTTTTEKYTIEAEAFEYPQPQPDTTLYAAPPAVYVPPPVPALPVSVQTDEQPNYSLVKVDMTPKSVVRKVESPPKQEEEKQERPIYKTVAHIETKERPRPKPMGVDMTDSKTYKIVTTKPTPVEEVQESQVSLDEVDYRMTTENIEYKLTSPGYESKQYYVRNSTAGAPAPASPSERFRSEKRLELSQDSNQRHKTEIQVKDTKDYDSETYEQNSYSYDKMVQNMENTDGNMRVVRGSYLIKNTLDEVDGSLDDNLNLFDGNFTLRKDNPLYQSDEDIYKRFEREKAENARKQERFQRDLNNDITFETVDKFSKSKEGNILYVFHLSLLSFFLSFFLCTCIRMFLFSIKPFFFLCILSFFSSFFLFLSFFLSFSMLD